MVIDPSLFSTPVTDAPVIADRQWNAEELIIDSAKGVRRLPLLGFESGLQGQRLVDPVAQGSSAADKLIGVAAKTAAARAVFLGNCVEQKVNA